MSHWAIYLLRTLVLQSVQAKASERQSRNGVRGIMVEDEDIYLHALLVVRLEQWLLLYM